jgi:DNA-binding transcriptional ArsR family regulator
MLTYLVTSRARRELLRLLWLESVAVSVSELTRRTGFSFGAVHQELEEMSAAGLAVSRREGRRLVHEANREHRHADVLLALLEADEPNGVEVSPEDDKVRSWLRQAGAPVGAPPPMQPVPPVESVLADGLVLAHRDPTVASVLPIVVWKQRSALDLDRLTEEATRRNERQALAYFLELTGRLASDRSLVAHARTLHDKRRRRAQPFFRATRSPVAIAQARRNTPALARRWGFWMNMGLDRFASAFAKHAGRR